MDKAKQVINLLNEKAPDSKGYADSYAGWKSRIKRSADEVADGFGWISKALASEDEKEVQRAMGYMDGLLDELRDNAEDLKRVNKQLLNDVSKPDIKGSDFWK